MFSPISMERVFEIEFSRHWLGCCACGLGGATLRTCNFESEETSPARGGFERDGVGHRDRVGGVAATFVGSRLAGVDAVPRGGEIAGALHGVGDVRGIAAAGEGEGQCAIRL